MIDEGHRSRTPRVELYWLPNHLGHPRLGVIVPRHGASIVARNRLRRRLRELLRRRVLRRAGATDLVARARADAYRATPAALADDLLRWPAT